MLLSVVITTYNRSGTLAEVLAAFENQTDRDFEIVVAMDNCSDNTLEVLENMSTSYPLTWVDTHCEGYGLAVARNMGVLAARGEAIVILDDDSFPSPGFVAAHKRSAADGVITAGPRRPADAGDERQLEKMRAFDAVTARSPMPLSEFKRRWPLLAITECNMSMMKKDFMEMGMFSERLKLYGFIGQEFFARAEHLGFQYQYDPDAETTHKRQEDGDNELSSRRKKREIMIARALRPALMQEDQYAVQIAWARQIAGMPEVRTPLPPLPVRAWLLFPYRFARNRGNDLKHALRRLSGRKRG